MTPELTALYHLHRFQIVLNARDRDGEYRFPEAFLYAVARGIYPLFHEGWCAGSDPYAECYDVKKEFIEQVATSLDELWQDSKQIPTFYELEKQYGHEHRADLIRILRYCHLDKRFGKPFYDAILKRAEHPVEASAICDKFSEQDLALL
jgi:hypothetical protein